MMLEDSDDYQLGQNTFIQSSNHIFIFTKDASIDEMMSNDNRRAPDDQLFIFFNNEGGNNQNDQINFTQLLQKKGLSVTNQSLMYLQMSNALLNQMDILEKIVFKRQSQPIYNYGIGFQASQQQNSNKAIGKMGSTESNLSGVYEGKLNAFINQDWIIKEQDKIKYLELRKKFDLIRKAIMQNLNIRDGKNHICLLCKSQFQNGRKLGGHMSRKHPRRISEYNKKRRIHITKTVQRERRNYFRQIRGPEKKKMIKKEDTSK